MNHIIVGDVHMTSSSLLDCDRLLTFVNDVAVKEKARSVLFLGDQYNDHATLDVNCVAMWKTHIRHLLTHCKVTMLVGNHDQVHATKSYPHALIVHPEVSVVDKPQDAPHIANAIAMPYIHEPKQFLEELNKTMRSGVKTLFCHQTFTGAKENSMVFDGVAVDELPSMSVISGHIHTPQQVGDKVEYIGAPRWMTRSDANVKKNIWVYDDVACKLTRSYKTSEVCSVFYHDVDTEKKQAVKPAELRDIDKWYVDIYGSAAYIKQRQAELGGLARIRTIVDTANPVVYISEVEGVEQAMSKYLDTVSAPNGTPVDDLKSEIHRRKT